MMSNICVLGDGGWGTTVAILLQQKGHQVTLWSYDPDYALILDKERENKRFFPGIKIPPGISITSNLSLAVSDKEIIILAVPSIYIRAVLSRLSGFKKDIIFVSLAKGIEQESFKRVSEIICEELDKVKMAVLSGPAIAYEVAKKSPSSVVVASEDDRVAKIVQELFFTPVFRVYTSSDVIGLELGGALKNVIAIAAGICDGLGFGTNTKAALLSRGLAEMVRFGRSQGALSETLFGLSGLGDMVTTSFSLKSRNRTLGEEIGRGAKLDDVLRNKNTVAEGIYTVKALHGFTKSSKIEMPIAEQIYRVLYNNKDPYKAVSDLMAREAKPESYSC
ncbi:MAG: NAD(P)H-dependent glycerol-3-phosphate dehydrogenase [Candidatus Kaelpia imicola]|nr:NAD(P)H-dependent glycerol-3-phosphate dehydrogenase [Candidatus Kaelpia imicola]